MSEKIVAVVYFAAQSDHGDRGRADAAVDVFERTVGH
jgi:hypothetical protein